MTLTDWLQYIRSIHVSAIDLGLSRIFPVAEKFNLTQFDCPVITVAGTNGKGSTVRALEVIYQQAGYKVAAYTSPHIIDFKERLRVNDKLLTDKLWCDAFEKIGQARGKISLSFFEFTLLAALLICKSEAPDVLILEIGLGGRLDAVNVVENDVGILTSVALDHTEWLGDTREKIATEKAAIVRQHLICGEPDPPAVIQQVCRDKKAVCYQINRDFRYVDEQTNWSFCGMYSQYVHLKKPPFILSNVASAMMTIELLGNQLPVAKVAISAAMDQMALPGRFEELPMRPKVIFDVAHNPHAAKALRDRLVAMPGKFRAVFSSLDDKATDKMAAALFDVFEQWYIGGLEGQERGLSSEAIVAKIATAGIKNCYTFETVSEAIKGAMEESAPEDTIVVWGSFHTVGEAKQWLREEFNERTI